MNTLTQRYVHAAVAGLPESQRDDVAQELHTSLADAIDDLMTGGLSREAAERQALDDLGDPAVLAERFGGRPRHLIGPAYFGQYSQLLRTLVLVVVPIVAVASLLAQALAGASPLDALFSVVGIVFQLVVQLAFWVTLVFAVLERSHTPVPGPSWSPDDLPEIPERRVGLGETVSGIALLTVLMWAILWQRDHWLVTVGGAEVPVLNAQVWSPWLVVLLVVLLASIVLEIVTYRVGQWTVALAAVNTVLNVMFAGIVMWLWTGERLLTEGVADLVPGGLLTPLVWIVVGIAVFDTVEGWWKALRP
jgi:hypothetical protein